MIEMDDSDERELDRFLIRRQQVKATPMGKVFVEIRAGEGGDDAKALVREQLAVYCKACKRSRL